MTPKATNSPASFIRRGFFISYTQQLAVTGGDLKRKWPHHVGLKVTRCGHNQQSYKDAMAINFGPDCQRELWASPYRLRFELNLGYTYPDQEEDAEARPCEHREVSVTWDQADILLWSQIAHDIGVTPQAAVLSKLVDVERGVTV
jgi:hypothetical protein